MELGYDLPEWGADGEFGSETERAVRAFQAANQLKTDGEYGAQSHRMMMELLAGRDAAEEDDSAADAQKVVEVTGGTVYVRAGAGKEYEILAVVRRGMRLEWTATAANGWHAVRTGGMSGWIGPKYAEVRAA